MVEIKKDGVYIDGNKFFLISGDFHYFRTLPGGWKRRLELMRDFGLTAVSTYVPWNLHESKKGEFYFENNADIVRFIKTADECGLKVILRLSPYLCGEWEMGGLPAWLLTDRTIGLRTSDPKFLKHFCEYTTVLVDKIRPYLHTNGGPVILVGLENEYGSYGNDKKYLKELYKFYRELGIDLPFISANGSDPFKYKNGTLPENWNGIDLGASPQSLGELDVLAGHQPDKPLFIGEAWVGHIQFWGKSFKVNRGAEKNAEFLKKALERDTVVNFYMFCGGTNFGFYNGALAVDAERRYTPLMTSYDYDAPISEEGRLRDKYFAMRDVLDDYLGKPRRPHVQPDYEAQNIKDVKYTAFAPFLDNTKNLAESTFESARPVCMEDAGQNYGFIRYTTHIGYTDDRERTLYLDGVCDRAYVYLDGVFAGVYMRDCENTPVKFTVGKDGLELSILLENTGRINYGYKIYDRKGIDTVRVDIQNPDGSYLYNFASNTNFTVETLPLKSLEKLEYSDKMPKDFLPVFCRAEFSAKAGVDTFIDMRGHDKGVVFVNGFNIGRFWHIGPQQTLYVPGELIKENNVVEVLELQFNSKKTYVDFIDNPILTEIEKEDHSTDGFELK